MARISLLLMVVFATCYLVSSSSLQQGECNSDADCPAWAPCCSEWGYCGTGSYCNGSRPTAPPSTIHPTTVHPTTASQKPHPPGSCESDADCPRYAPCCSEWGFCGSGEDYCNWRQHLKQLHWMNTSWRCYVTLNLIRRKKNKMQTWCF